MFGRVFTYTCGSWQKGNRKKSTHASGCEESGDLLEPHQYFRPFENRSKLHNPDIPRLSQSFIVVVFSFFFLFEYPLRESKNAWTERQEGRRTNHIVGTGCASCCDAYRSWRYPSLLRRISKNYRNPFDGIICCRFREQLTGGNVLILAVVFGRLVGWRSRNSQFGRPFLAECEFTTLRNGKVWAGLADHVIVVIVAHVTGARTMVHCCF
jgi:hypothetical protein